MFTNDPGSVYPLDEMDEREPSVVCGYDDEFPVERRERFEDMGLLAGETVRRLHTAALGDPIAFGVRGSVLCLRREDARHIRVRRVGSKDAR
ncbi:MAG: FeoA family protein [Elusimicrobiota bacterium]